MDDQELDRLLEAARPHVSDATIRVSVAMAARIRVEKTRRAGVAPRRRRLIWVVPVAALALSGAGTLSAYQLHVPPFQGLEPGVQRINPGIRITFDAPDGAHQSCLAFIEVRRVNEQQRAALEALAAEPDTSTILSRAQQEASRATGAAAAKGLSDAMWGLVSGRLPDMKHGLDGEPNAPTLSGYGMSCRPGEGG